ncbi:MAG: hypothetical protein QXS96_04990 [Candidatus Caldarchaeum sp.]
MKDPLAFVSVSGDPRFVRSPLPISSLPEIDRLAAIEAPLEIARWAALIGNIRSKP